MASAPLPGGNRYLCYVYCVAASECHFDLFFDGDFFVVSRIRLSNKQTMQFFSKQSKFHFFNLFIPNWKSTLGNLWSLNWKLKIDLLWVPNWKSEIGGLWCTKEEIWVTLCYVMSLIQNEFFSKTLYRKYNKLFDF